MNYDMKKNPFLIANTVVLMAISSIVGYNTYANSEFTAKDILSLKNIILNSGFSSNYDTNHDNKNDVLDLCTIKREYLTNTDYVTTGTETYQDFIVDNVLHSQNYGDIHYSVYIPSTYDGNEPYAIYFSLPGYEGLYFQGVGKNIQYEAFTSEAKKYNSKMIIVAPQLNDWRENSANQTIALVEYFLKNYNIDRSKVYANGYSGGGETMSLVMTKRPDLFSRYLHCSSQWDGDYTNLIENRVPIYLVVGENDEYYGSKTTKDTYNKIYSLYQQSGLTEQEIDKLLVLDIKDHSYFTECGMSNEHGGGGLFAYDNQIMQWLLN